MQTLLKSPQVLKTLHFKNIPSQQDRFLTFGNSRYSLGSGIHIFNSSVSFQIDYPEWGILYQPTIEFFTLPERLFSFLSLGDVSR